MYQVPRSFATHSLKPNAICHSAVSSDEKHLERNFPEIPRPEQGLESVGNLSQNVWHSAKSPIPIGSMGLVYLPTFTINIKQM